LDKPTNHMSVGKLERLLLARYPREDAEEWDRTGLLVGDPAAPLSGIACALDPTVEAVRTAHAKGANVLLTHHPVFLEPPSAFSSDRTRASEAGATVFEAARLGVALMNFHTALDVSHDAQCVLPGLLSLEFESVVEPLEHDRTKGYGQLCSVRATDAPMSVSQLASRCLSVFGRPGRVWGDMSKKLSKVVTATGSASSLLDSCLKAGADCIVCGEVKYHAALDATQAGLAIVELGHDVSELPLARVLAVSAVEEGVDSSSVSVLEQGSNWDTVESTRL